MLDKKLNDNLDDNSNCHNDNVNSGCNENKTNNDDNIVDGEFREK